MKGNILAIETSGLKGSLALKSDDGIFNMELEEPYKYSHCLNKNIKSLFQKANLSIQDLNTIVVNSGPGSFTGVRIGIAAALGLANALNISVHSVGSLQLLKHGWAGNQVQFLTYLLSYNDSLFIATWQKSDNGEIVLQEEEYLHISDIKQVFLDEYLWIGPQPDRINDVLIKFNKKAQVFSVPAFPQAQHMISLVIKNQAVDLKSQEIKYIRPFSAKNKKGDYTWP